MAAMRLVLPFTLVIVSFIISAYGDTHSVNILTSHGGKKTQLRTVTTSSCHVSIKLSHGAKFVASDQSCSIVSSSATVSCTGKAKIRGHTGKKKHSQKVSQLSHYGDANSKICSSAYWIKPQSTRKQVTCTLNTCPTKQNPAKITTPGFTPAAANTTASPTVAQAQLAGTLYFPDLTFASGTPSLTSYLCETLKNVTEAQGATDGVEVSNCTVTYQDGSLIATFEFAISCRSSTADLFGIALNAIIEDISRSFSHLLSAVSTAIGQTVTRVEVRETKCQRSCNSVYNSTAACTLPDCKTCATTSGQPKCYLCNDGHQPVSSSCLGCDANCASVCTVKGPGKCDSSCKPGYFFSNVTFTCAACDAHCQSGCTVQGPGKCDSLCQTGYMLATTSYCALPRQCRLDIMAWGQTGQTGNVTDGYINVTDVTTNRVDSYLANTPGDYLATVNMSDCSITNKMYGAWFHNDLVFSSIQTWNNAAMSPNFTQVIGIDLAVGPSNPPTDVAQGIFGSYAPYYSVWQFGVGWNMALYETSNGEHGFSAVLYGIQNGNVTFSDVTLTP